MVVLIWPDLKSDLRFAAHVALSVGMVQGVCLGPLMASSRRSAWLFFGYSATVARQIDQDIHDYERT
jgi:cytochrome b561